MADPYWQFGAFANASVTATVFEDGERKTETLDADELKVVDENIDPWSILASLGETSDTVRYQVKGVEYTSNEIQTMINDGDLTLTSAGSIVFNGETLEYAEVGYEVHTLMIEKLQDDIEQINELLEKLNYISAALGESTTFEEDGEITYNSFAAAFGSDEFFKLLKQETPELSDTERVTLLQDANNDYIYWENISGSTTSSIGTYRFGTTTLNTTQYLMTFQENDISNALEALRNTVKEKTTQTETLSTDFQSSNEQYTSVITAMSQYAEDFYGSIKQLTD
ncbi:MAG: hypothetical protein VX100_20990 [Pseudomonadota bacterium]|nr:hypothetical protein [Pseudomonadota bacterium]